MTRSSRVIEVAIALCVRLMGHGSCDVVVSDDEIIVIHNDTSRVVLKEHRMTRSELMDELHSWLDMLKLEYGTDSEQTIAVQCSDGIIAVVPGESLPSTEGCRRCGGRGEVERAFLAGNRTYTEMETCPACSGSGVEG